MKNGDIVVNVNDKYLAVFEGWVAGQVSSYIIYNGDQEEKFLGTTPELLMYCAIQVENLNLKNLKF